MSNRTKPLAAALGAAFLASSVMPLASAGSNPFSAQQLSGGYDLPSYASDKEGSCGEGRCGGSAGKGGDEGKCGESKAEGEGKCGEGKCGESKAEGEGKCGEGKCGESKADSEGSCGEGKSATEGKCGEGKCGGS